MTEHQIDRLWIVVALIWVAGMLLMFTAGCAKPAIKTAPPEPVWKLPSGLAHCEIQERTHYSDGSWRIILACSDSYRIVKR
jgi:hypothetical protein